MTYQPHLYKRLSIQNLLDLLELQAKAKDEILFSKVLKAIFKHPDLDCAHHIAFAIYHNQLANYAQLGIRMPIEQQNKILQNLLRRK